MGASENLIGSLHDGNIEILYEHYKDDPMIKWKDSIKKVVGIERPTETGMDI